MTGRARLASLLAAAGLILGACSGAGGPSSSSGSSGRTAGAPTAPPAVGGGTAPTVPRQDAAGTVWLCRPGLADDPCAGNLDLTVVSADGTRSEEHPVVAGRSAFDCFYVYPTVSTEKGANSDLVVKPAETAAAEAQAGPFSRVCRVWAPMYRQRTAIDLARGLGGDPAADAVAYASVLAGWQDYVSHYNDSRPVVLIGHSQGAAMLIRLIEGQIDADPTLRRRLVSAIILGGNVTVPTGGTVGGSFAHVPLCTTPSGTGCVIAYSSFPSQPPPAAQFGRPGQGVSLQSGQTRKAGMQVACVNPAAIGGGTAGLDPYFPTASEPPPGAPVTTPWVSYPGLYTATCRSAGGASWLQVDDIAGPGDARPVVHEGQGPDWGYHGADVSLALGNLVADVAAEEAEFPLPRR